MMYVKVAMKFLHLLGCATSPYRITIDDVASVLADHVKPAHLAVRGDVSRSLEDAKKASTKGASFGNAACRDYEFLARL